MGILCYQQAGIIARTIESALQQDEPADEVLVVDDGSDDGSVSVVRGFAGVRLVTHDRNRGRTWTRNTLLAETTGDVLVFLDGDTAAHPSLVRHLLAGYVDDRVGGVGGRGQEVVCETPYDRWRCLRAVQSWGSDPTDQVPWLYGLCSSYRTELLRRLGGFHGFGEDQDIGYRVRGAGYRLSYRPDAIVEHLRTDDWSSFVHLMYRWWRGGYMVDRRYGLPAMRHMAGEAVIDALKQIPGDLIRGDAEMAWVDVVALTGRFQGIARGVVLAREERRRGLRAAARLPAG